MRNKPRGLVLILVWSPQVQLKTLPTGPQPMASGTQGGLLEDRIITEHLLGTAPPYLAYQVHPSCPVPSVLCYQQEPAVGRKFPPQLVHSTPFVPQKPCRLGPCSLISSLGLAAPAWTPRQPLSPNPCLPASPPTLAGLQSGGLVHAGRREA